MASRNDRRKRSTGERGKGARSKPAARSTVPAEVSDRIVREIGDGVGLVTVARRLNADEVPTGGTAAAWTPQKVRAVYLRATGASGIKAVREQAPLKRGETSAA
jgi:hypothetical protein